MPKFCIISGVIHDAINSFNLRVTVTTKSSPLHTILVLLPHESLPIPEPVPEADELPCLPRLLKKLPRKLEEDDGPPTIPLILEPIPEVPMVVTILEDKANFFSSSFGS